MCMRTLFTPQGLQRSPSRMNNLLQTWEWWHPAQRNTWNPEHRSLLHKPRRWATAPQSPHAPAHPWGRWIFLSQWCFLRREWYTWLVLLGSFTGQYVITTIHILKLAFGPHDHTNTLSQITPPLPHHRAQTLGGRCKTILFSKRNKSKAKKPPRGLLKPPDH